MEDNIKKMNVLYLVNAHLPNDRANGVQIAHTCENLGKQVNLTLATRITHTNIGTCTERYGITQTFKHKRIFCIDISGLPLRYAIRNTSFFVSANIYALYFLLKNFLSGKKAVVYVRGEVILSLIPLAYIFPIFFETHQIRNFEWFYRIALRNVRGIVVITDRLKQKFIDEYTISSKKIIVARDAVDLKKFTSVVKDSSLWEKNQIPSDKKIVLYAGTLSAEKGVHTLAAAASFVPKNVQIVFLGGVDEQISAFRNTYKDVPNISIIGRVSYIEVPQYIVSADVLILPDSGQYTYSNLYTSPMKLFEYMASGRVIVAAKVPSLCEVLADDSAIFFEPDNAESLAKGIQRACTDDVLVTKLQIRAQEVVSEFTWEKRADAIIRLIENRFRV